MWTRLKRQRITCLDERHKKPSFTAENPLHTVAACLWSRSTVWLNSDLRLVKQRSARIESRPGHGLSEVKCVMVFLSACKELQGQYHKPRQERLIIFSCISLLCNHSTWYRMVQIYLSLVAACQLNSTDTLLIFLIFLYYDHLCPECSKVSLKKQTVPNSAAYVQPHHHRINHIPMYFNGLF